MERGWGPLPSLIRIHPAGWALLEPSRGNGTHAPARQARPQLTYEFCGSVFLVSAVLAQKAQRGEEVGPGHPSSQGGTYARGHSCRPCPLAGWTLWSQLVSAGKGQPSLGQ